MGQMAEFSGLILKNDIEIRLMPQIDDQIIWTNYIEIIHTN